MEREDSVGDFQEVWTVLLLIVITLLGLLILLKNYSPAVEYLETWYGNTDSQGEDAYFVQKEGEFIIATLLFGGIMFVTGVIFLSLYVYKMFKQK